MSEQQLNSIKPKEPAEKTRYLIPAVHSAIEILKYLSRNKHKSENLTQISTDLALNRSTAYRILTTLQHDNMVEYDSIERTYRLGPEVAVLGARMFSLNDFLRKAELLVKQVAAITNNTTVLVQRVSYDKIGYIIKSEPNSPVHVSVSLGQVFPITAGSHGKVFLAYMDSDEQKKILNELGPVYFTDETRDPDHLDKEFDQIRKDGFAISWEEHLPGITGVAVPIFRGEAQFMGTISCIGLAADSSMEKLREMGTVVKKLIDKEYL